MDAIAPPDVAGYLISFPALRNELPRQTEALLQRLRAAQNCCSHCRPLWRQWLQIADSALLSAAARGMNAAHPSKPILIALKCMRSLSARLITLEDRAALAPIGINPASLPTEDLPESTLIYITRLVNMRNGKSEAQADDRERAAMHYYSRQAMNGLLKMAIKYRLRQTIINRNRDYYSGDNDLPPYRDTAGKTITIQNIADLSAIADSGKHYRAHAVRPFISLTSTGAERGRLFPYLDCRILTGDDVPPQESRLIGQWGVVAAKLIPRATCLGIFAGVLVSPQEMGDADLFDHAYIIDLSLKGQPITYLDSDGILSKINTRYKYDDHGMPVSQAKTGYNVESAKFKACLEGGRRVNVIALFATEDIPAGREIRLNYHIPSALILNNQ
ncbi:hypothetical protein [Sodalis sp. RH16]|uniref:hypothetical protein n=1 Tax=Sodalis sp. RH16 TaxID=3394331 RepID=UPI0039B599C7